MVRFTFARLAKILLFVIFTYIALSLLSQSSNKQDSIDNETAVKSKEENFLRQVEAINDNSDVKAVFQKGKLGNYEPNLKPRYGPGENGEGVILKDHEIEAGKNSVREYGFNMVASGKISMDRRIMDTRDHNCKFWSYPDVKKLPTASVVLVFVNEGFTTLMRTVHSVINTSPPELLAEIILVDDFSSKSDLKQPLEKYIERFDGKVKLIRNSQQEGLVKARVIGAKSAVGEVIVILDAHCECVTNWLPPLLQRIALNRKTLACPIVDGIDWNTLKHENIYGTSLKRGIFEWGFLYKENDVPQKELNKHAQKTEPYWSPTHAGGLLAIEKKWFFELGGYDPGIKIWGAEQYELSFKVWQCGGIVEWVPCSRVAHIYRGPRTESTHPKGGNVYQTKINHMRLAEVWMDEYRDHFYTRDPAIGKLDFGDVSEQKALRARLQCKPFSFFMNEIAYDLTEKFPVPPKNKVWGEVVNEKSQVCLDVLGRDFGQPIGVGGCHHQGGSQLFRINVEGEMSSDESCFISDHDKIIKKFCLNPEGVWNPIGEWDYNKETKSILSHNEKKCVSTDGAQLTLEECDSSDPKQQFIFNEIYY